MGIVVIALVHYVFFWKDRLRLNQAEQNRREPLATGFRQPVHIRKPIISSHTIFSLVLAYAVGFGYFNHLLGKIKEVENLPIEREISFRTECGFYYSYYKQLVAAPTLLGGIKDLTNDITSEFPTSVNALARFNIHPEVALAFLYRLFGDKTEDPILFYTRWVWFLQGIQASALFLLAVFVCRSIIGGFLSTLLFCHMRPFATRAFFTVSLRENFSMPFFWVRLLMLTIIFRSKMRDKQRNICLGILSLATFCFSSSWQLSPFIIFAQGLPLYGGAMLNALDMSIVEKVMCVDAAVIFFVGLLHFAYPLFLSSPAITCACLVYISNRLVPPPPGPRRRFFSTVFRCVILVLSGLFSSGLIKKLLGVTDDNHVFKLFLAKLNLAYHHDFDVNMYLASSVFRAQTPQFFIDLTFGAFFLMPIYLICHVIFLLGVLKVFEETTSRLPLTDYEAKKKDLTNEERTKLEKEHPPSLLAVLLMRRPELSVNALTCAPMAALGIFIQRLQLLWTPHMCIFYAWVLTTPALYTLIPLPSVLRKWVPRISRYVLPTLLMLLICSGYIPAIKHELSLEMRVRFADPDAVNLMEWISNNTRPSGVFTGSMQLMSAVRLSTGRAITNHPHYENGDLREKTRILYRAIYGRSTPRETYQVMRDLYGVDYIVIEPSICFAPDNSHQFSSFRTVDMLDQADGLQPEGGPFAGDPRLKAPDDVENPKRPKTFCELVQPDQADKLKYVVDAGVAEMARHPLFKRVYHSQTFWIYEVMQ